MQEGGSNDKSQICSVSAKQSGENSNGYIEYVKQCLSRAMYLKPTCWLTKANHWAIYSILKVITFLETVLCVCKGVPYLNDNTEVRWQWVKTNSFFFTTWRSEVNQLKHLPGMRSQFCSTTGSFVNNSQDLWNFMFGIFASHGSWKKNVIFKLFVSLSITADMAKQFPGFFTAPFWFLVGPDNIMPTILWPYTTVYIYYSLARSASDEMRGP